MNDSLFINILTPEKQLYEGEITAIVSQNKFGSFEILPNHTPFITAVVPAVTFFTEKSGKKLKAFTSDGILKVDGDKIELLCEAAEWPEEIDLKRAEEAKERAQERINKKDGIDIKRAQFALKRSLMRIQAKNNFKFIKSNCILRLDFIFLISFKFNNFISEIDL